MVILKKILNSFINNDFLLSFRIFDEQYDENLDNLLINGKRIDLLNYNSNSLYPQDVGPLRLGKVKLSGADHFLDGSFKEIIIFNRALSKDEMGNVYSIFAEYGEIKDQASNIIFLKNVKAKISILNSDDINIKSDYAKYNSKNYDTNFYENTKIDYAEHNINCEYLDLLFNKKLAILYESIVYKNLQTKLLADRLEIDLISKNSTLSMKDK